jgi:hypothetical protein
MAFQEHTTSENPPIPPPPFWTLDYHLHFFPKLVWQNLKNHPDSRKGHVLIEIPIALVACGLLISWGLPSAIDKHSPFGWFLAALGASGIIALIVFCLKATAGTQLSYSEFEPWTFLLLVFFGFFSGLLGPGIYLKLPLSIGLAGSVVGLTLGYLLGIPAGLFAQRLGPLRAFLALAAGFGLLVVVGTGLIGIFIMQKP